MEIAWCNILRKRIIARKKDDLLFRRTVHFTVAHHNFHHNHNFTTNFQKKLLRITVRKFLEILLHSPKLWKMDLRFGLVRKLKTFWRAQECCSVFSVPLNTSYLTDSYISFTLNLESGQNVCSNRSIRSSTYGKKNISDFPPCGKLVIFVNEFVIFLKTSK